MEIRTEQCLQADKTSSVCESFNIDSDFLLMGLQEDCIFARLFIISISTLTCIIGFETPFHT